MSTTVTTSYPVKAESGLVDYPLGGVVGAVGIQQIKDAVTHGYAWGGLRALQWSSESGLTAASTTYQSVARSTWRLATDRSKLTITGYGDTVTLRVRVYESDGTTLLATAEDASGGPGEISAAITSGITSTDIVVDISVKCTSGTSQTLYRYAVIEQPMAAADLP